MEAVDLRSCGGVQFKELWVLGLGSIGLGVRGLGLRVRVRVRVFSSPEAQEEIRLLNRRLSTSYLNSLQLSHAAKGKGKEGQHRAQGQSV